MKQIGVVTAVFAACLFAACEKPKDDDAAKEPAGAMGETISVPPTVSADAPSEPHMGEPPSPNQPQPVVPGGAAVIIEEDTMVVETPDGEAMMETDTIVVAPTVSEDAPSGPHMGEPPSPNQPQPVVPDTAASDMVEAEAADKMINETTNAMPSGQPQPVYPDGKPDGM